jgi:multidrug resistance efflux pump
MSDQIRIRIPFRSRILRVRTAVLPLVLWLAAVVGTVWLAGRQNRWVEAVGIVETREAIVSSSTEGVLRGMAVDLFDEVREGQVVAALDDTVLRAELRTVEREVDQLRADLAAEEIRLRFTDADEEHRRLDEVRRAAMDLEDSRLDYLDRLVVLEVARVELARVEVSLGRQEALVRGGSLDEAALDDLEYQRDALKEQIAGEGEGVQAALARISDASDRLTRFRDVGTVAQLEIETLLEPFRRAVIVGESRVVSLSAQREALLLKSPFTGIVSRVLRRTGESVLVGEPIVHVADPHSERIIAHLDEARAGRIRPGLEVRIRRRSDPVRVASAEVLRVGPAVDQTPIRLWRDARRPEWGLPILIGSLPDVSLLPGEIVNVWVFVGE